MVEYLNGVRTRFDHANAAIMLALDYEGDAELTAVALPKVEMYLLAHRDHPLNQRTAPADRNTLADYVELVVADSSNQSEGNVHRLFLGSPNIFELSDFHSKREALLSGVGYGWLPAHLARRAMERGTLVEIPFVEGSTHTFEPHLVYRAGPSIGRAGRLFIDLFLKETRWSVNGAEAVLEHLH